MGCQSVYQVIVTGAGPAGLAVACLLARDGLDVACISGAPSVAPADPRTVALMLPSIRGLKHLGMWPGKLQSVAAPLRTLRLIDDTGSLISAPTVSFGADEVGEDAFGWNIPIEDLIKALRLQAQMSNVTFIEQNAASLRARRDHAEVVLASGDGLKGQVVAAADGRNSRMRTTGGIGTVEWSYDQAAIAASFDHSADHHGISSEYHKPAGPLTTVPMPGKRSSLVWMELPQRASQIMAMSDIDFAKLLQVETHGDLGLISGPGPRRSFPMRGLTASAFARNRLILIGEAAHVVPPIGAQGLNMSMRDAALAAELIGDATRQGGDPGAPSVMETYDAERRRDVMPRQAAIHMLNSSLLSSLAPFHSLRAIGLTAVSQIGPLRQTIVKQGLSPQSGLPRIMRV